MTDAEKLLLAEHARELLDLGPSWVCGLVVRDIRGHWSVHLSRGHRMLGVTIPVADHTAWLAARAKPLPETEREQLRRVGREAADIIKALGSKP
jgi:hypothetical protein